MRICNVSTNACGSMCGKCCKVEGVLRLRMRTWTENNNNHNNSCNATATTLPVNYAYEEATTPHCHKVIFYTSAACNIYLHMNVCKYSHRNAHTYIHINVFSCRSVWEFRSCRTIVAHIRTYHTYKYTYISIYVWVHVGVYIQLSVCIYLYTT